MEDRLTELETKISFQDQTIEELNQLVTEQQRQIDNLKKQFKKFAALAEAEEEPRIVDISLEVPPPHY